MNKNISMQVSIITPTYNIIKNNRKDFFKQMIESVQNQTYKNIEHIIIDGGSDDGSIKYIKSLIDPKHNNVKFLSEPDTGIYNAMNKGIKMASGYFIAFMNTDDYYYDNRAIELLVDSCQRFDADFSCGTALISNRRGKIKEMIPDLDSALYSMPFCHQTMLCKLEMFNQYGAFDESYKLASDYEFILKSILRGAKASIVEKNEKLVFFRYFGASHARSEEVKKEASIIMRKHIDKTLSTKDWENIFCSRFSALTLFKLLCAYPFNQNLRPIIHSHYVTASLKQLLKHMIRFRFIIRNLEKLYKTVLR